MLINVKQNNVEKDAATQRISRTQVRQKRKHVQTSLLVNRLHHREDRVEQPSWFGVSWYLLLLAAGVVIVVIKGIIIACFSFIYCYYI